jgi:maltose alpha-D-glucosyltransferase/alpha-amylase
MRRECPELGWGDFTVLRTETPDVLVLRYDFRGVSMLTLHNFSNRPKTIVVDPKVKGGNVLTDVFDENHSRTENGTHEMKLPPYGHRWMRVGAIDNAPNRTPF